MVHSLIIYYVNKALFIKSWALGISGEKAENMVLLHLINYLLYMHIFTPSSYA